MLLKQDLRICIREAGTSATLLSLPVKDTSVDINTKEVSSSHTRTTIGNPKFTDLTVNEGVKETTIKFTVYSKPYAVNNIAEKLLLDSLFGSSQTNPSDIVFTTVNSYDIPRFDIFIIYNNGASFQLENAVTQSANFKFDINQLTETEFTIIGNIFKEVPIENYSPAPDGTYIQNMWTKIVMDFPQTGRIFNLASTGSNILISNTIEYPYNSVVTKRFTNASDTPIIKKRDIDLNLSIYLKVCTLNFYNELIQSIETSSYLDNPSNLVLSIGCGGVDNLTIALDNIVLKYPKIKVNEIANLDIKGKGTSAVLTYKE